MTDDYDPAIDSLRSWEVAIAALRERHLAHERLRAEYNAAGKALEDRDWAERRQLGIEFGGIARVRDIGGGLYEPEDSPFGHWRWITGVYTMFPDTPEQIPDTSPMTLIDLVAWSEVAPEEWLLRTGRGQWMGWIPWQDYDPEPVRIFRSPLSWLRDRSNRPGLMILCKNRIDILHVLLHCRAGVVAEDRAHAAALRNVLEYPSPRPAVYVARE